MRKSHDESVRWEEIFAAGYIVPLTLVCFGIWLHASDELIVATLMPSIVKEIGGEKFLAWTLALYEIGSIVAGASSALLSIRFGIRLPMAISAVVFGCGCAVSALAPDMTIVLAGRLLQGLGGGALVSMSFISAGLFFPARLSARVIAALSALWGIAAFTGPLIGGVFAHFDAWRGGFWFFGAQAWLLALWIFYAVPEAKISSQEEPINRVPWKRLSLLSAGIILIASAGIDTAPLRMTILILGGLICCVMFFVLDNRQNEHRLFPRNALSLRNQTGAILTGILLLSAACVPLAIYGPLLMTMLHKASALVAGYILACGAIGWSLTAISFSGLPERHDARMVFTGAIVISLSVPCLAYAVPTGPLWLIGAFAGMQGAGFGIAWTFILRRAGSLAPADDRERVASAIPTMQRIGYATGAALIGIIANFSGLSVQSGPENTSVVAMIIFMSCIPMAVMGLFAVWQFVKVR